jgi:8-oxo-dGTP pyrophosphatase MutT (NUDIX family)
MRVAARIQRQTRSVGKRMTLSEKGIRQLQKVSILCIRGDSELLVFRHDRGGVQVPAGTVEVGEDVATAAVRELQEETGIIVKSVTRLFSLEEQGEIDERVVTADLPLHEAPDSSSPIIMPSLWRTWVRVREIRGEFARVVIETWDDLDRVPATRSVSAEGFVLASVLRTHQMRHVFHAVAPTDVAERWEVFAENQYFFRCYWAPLDNHGLIGPHSRWVEQARPLFPKVRLNTSV